jgi:protein CLEC16A
MNRINELITYRFDFTDDDLLARYVSFLKTLALKLDRDTVQLFYNDRKQEFPLITEAALYHDSSDGMIQAAVRNLVLQVFKGTF